MQRTLNIEFEIKVKVPKFTLHNFHFEKPPYHFERVLVERDWTKWLRLTRNTLLINNLLS
jgi:hypothetical protein